MEKTVTTNSVTAERMFENVSEFIDTSEESDYTIKTEMLEFFYEEQQKVSALAQPFMKIEVEDQEISSEIDTQSTAPTSSVKTIPKFEDVSEFVGSIDDFNFTIKMEDMMFCYEGQPENYRVPVFVQPSVKTELDNSDIYSKTDMKMITTTSSVKMEPKFEDVSEFMGSNNEFDFKVLTEKLEFCYEGQLDDLKEIFEETEDPRTNTDNCGTQEFFYKCMYCPYKTTNKNTLKEHILIYNYSMEGPKYKCELCEFEAKNKNNLAEHMLIHKGPLEISVYKCEMCSFETKHKGSIVMHRKRHKKQETEIYECLVCSYKTITKGSFSQHQHMKCHRK